MGIRRSNHASKEHQSEDGIFISKQSLVALATFTFCAAVNGGIGIASHIQEGHIKSNLTTEAEPHILGFDHLKSVGEHILWFYEGSDGKASVVLSNGSECEPHFSVHGTDFFGSKTTITDLGNCPTPTPAS